MLHKRSIIRKTIEVGGFTLLSRLLGIIREFLQVRYIGAEALSDAFLTAYSLPNSLRKIFAEGALSVAFIPTFVRLVRQDKRDELDSLMSLAFIMFEGAVLLLCILAMIYAHTLIYFMVPGFSLELINRAVPLLRILMPFIFFLSSSSLLAGALQAINHFFVPAFSPVLLNIVYIVGLLFCLFNQLPVEYLCFAILCGGVFQFLLHLYAYYTFHFSFGSIQEQTWSYLWPIITKFSCCLVAMSVMEINLFIDKMFASYLPAGSITLIYYANRFLGIPMGVFAIAFSTILLPHFSRVSEYAPKRLSFYLLESVKLIFWVTIPATIAMIFFAEKIFHTIFLSKKFSMLQVFEARNILIAFVIGLFFLACNRILLNLYYAMHITWLPAVISIVGAVLNISLNFLLVYYLQAVGLALGTTLSGIVQTAFFVVGLCWRFDLRFYGYQFMLFVKCYLVQLAAILMPFFLIYYLMTWFIEKLPAVLVHFFLYSIGFWLWVGPLCFTVFGVILITRKWFNVRLYFLD